MENLPDLLGVLLDDPFVRLVIALVAGKRLALRAVDFASQVVLKLLDATLKVGTMSLSTGQEASLALWKALIEVATEYAKYRIHHPDE